MKFNIKEWQEKHLIRESKLPKGYSIYRLSKDRYTFEYQEFSREWTIKELQQIEKKLVSMFKKLGLNKTYEPVSVWVRHGDIAIGVAFTTKEDLEKLGYDVYDRE